MKIHNQKYRIGLPECQGWFDDQQGFFWLLLWKSVEISFYRILFFLISQISSIALYEDPDYQISLHARENSWLVKKLNYLNLEKHTVLLTSWLPTETKVFLKSPSSRRRLLETTFFRIFFNTIYEYLKKYEVVIEILYIN